VNLEYRSEMCWKRLAGNTGPEKLPSGHHRTTWSGYIFASKARIDTREKLVKQRYLHMFSQYGELRPTSGWERFVSLGHPSKFQRVSRLGSVTVRHSTSGWNASEYMLVLALYLVQICRVSLAHLMRLLIRCCEKSFSSYFVLRSNNSTWSCC